MKHVMKSALVLSTALYIGACQTAEPTRHFVQVKAKKSPYWEILESQQGQTDLYTRGRAHLAATDYGLAINAFRQDIQVNGPSIKSLNGLAVTYDMLKRYDLSQKYYEQALALEPKTALTYSNLAYSQYKQGEYDNAVKLADAAKELVKDDGDITKVAEANKVMAETQFKMAQDSVPEEEIVLAGHVIERITERHWQMEKPKQKPIITAERYTADIPISKILKRKEEAEKETIESEKTSDNTEESDIEISKDTDTKQEDIVLANATEPKDKSRWQVQHVTRTSDRTAGRYVPEIRLVKFSSFQGDQETDLSKNDLAATPHTELAALNTSALPVPAVKPVYTPMVIPAVKPAVDNVGSIDILKQVHTSSDLETIENNDTLLENAVYVPKPSLKPEFTKNTEMDI